MEVAGNKGVLAHGGRIAFLRDRSGADARERVPPVWNRADARERVPPVRNPPLFQRDCWDRQLRTGEIYTQKWEYVRNNPVRKGLVANADGWPYQGRMNILEWHERI